MPSLRIVLEPERDGLGLGIDPARIIHLSNDAEIIVTGLPDGMAGGAPSMAFAFKLPDGRAVIAETSWKLFSAAYMAFAGKFGDKAPNAAGIDLEYDATGAGQRVRVHLQDDELPQWFECEICGARTEEPPGVDGAQKITQWVHRHFREKHPGSAIPEVK